MRRTRTTTLIATLAALPLAAVACGTATTDAPGDGPGSGGPTTAPSTSQTPTPESARAFATALLARVQVPSGATAVEHAPSKVLESLPEQPGLVKPPLVVDRFWSVDSSAQELIGWLRSHAPAGLDDNGSGMSGSGGSTAQFLAYRSSSLPSTVAFGALYLSVVSTGPATSALAAHALALAQPRRPAAEIVPVADVSTAMIGWSLAPSGTPVRKVLTGDEAAALARDFNAIPVSVTPTMPCPLIPTASGDIVVRFTADGHTWAVDVPACPAITVTRDGQKLPALDLGKVFLDDLEQYVGHLPQSGPPHAGRVIPLNQPPTGH